MSGPAGSYGRDDLTREPGTMRSPNMITVHKKFRRGAVAALAMIYLMLFGTLTLAMFSMATLNAKSSTNFNEVDRARAAAESGLHWIQYRFVKMARPKSTVGDVTATVANY